MAGVTQEILMQQSAAKRKTKKKSRAATEGWLLGMLGVFTGGGLCSLPKSAV